MLDGDVVTAAGTEVATFPTRWRRKTWSIHQRSLKEAPCFCSRAEVETLDMIRCEESLMEINKDRGWRTIRLQPCSSHLEKTV